MTADTDQRATEAAAQAGSSAAVLIHGATMARRSLLARAIRQAIGGMRVRASGRAAEAAKCLADPAVVAVLLLDAPADADMVRAAAAQRGLGRHTYDVEPRDDADVVVRLVRSALETRRGVRY